VATQSRYYTNTSVENTIGNPGGISSSATSVYCATTPEGYLNEFPWTLRLDPGTASEELVTVTSGGGTSASPWQITRGYDGTTAVSHAQGANLVHGMSAGDLTTSRQHEASGSGSGVHGLPAAAWQIASFAVINETVLENSTTTTLTWNSIPQTYSHLLMVVQARSTYTSATLVAVGASINGDTSASYGMIDLHNETSSGTLGSPSSVTASAQTSWAGFINIPGSQSGSSVNQGGGYALLPNYAGTVAAKNALSFSGFSDGTDALAALWLRAFGYKPTTQAGITSISLSVASGYYQSGSFFGLYAFGSA
jgi:hypothetical protein